MKNEGWKRWTPGERVEPPEWPVACIGPGRVGSALVRALAAAGFPIALIGPRGAASEALASEVGAETMDAPYAGLGERARLIVVTTPDDAIGAVAGEIAGAGELRPGAALVHASATELSGTLAGDAARRDLLYLSLHPFKPFADRGRGPEHFHGVFLAVEGEGAARELGHELARLIGGRGIDLSPESKALYHAAGILSATGAMALARAATIIASLIGLEEAFVSEAILPGMHAAVDIAGEQGLPEGLTGPVSRGDVRVVARHLDALRQHAPELVPLYLEVARLNLRMAAEGGTLDEETLARLKDALDLS